MTWDSDAPKSSRLTFLGVNNTQAGIEAANLFDVFASDQGLTTGNVGVLSGVQSSLNLQERVDGFVQQLQSLRPEFTVTKVAYTDEEEAIDADGAQQVEDIIRSDPDLVGIFFAGPWPFFGDWQNNMPLWQTAADSGAFVTISFDTLPDLLDLVSQGRIQGLVGQKYWAWGYDSIQILHGLATGGAVDGPFTDSGYDLITLCNVDEISAAWEAQVFPNEDFISREAC